MDITKRANAAFNAGDVEGFLSVLAPEAEMVDLANAPDQRQTLKGPAAIRGALELWSEAFQDFHAEVEEYAAVGDCVICKTHWVGRGKGSGISIDVHQFDLYEFRDGRVIAATLGYKSKQDALGAAEDTIKPTGAAS